MEIKKHKILLEPESLSLGYLTIGEGSPKTLLLSGVHGNEKTGQLIIDRLLKTLTPFSGTLTVLPIANPTGFSNNTRQETISSLDLNRNFFDDSDNPASELLRTITQLTKQHDYVIDLHNFTTDGLIQVVSNHVGSADHLAMLFKPDITRTSGKNQVLKKTGTLTQYLKDAGIPYVLLELPVHHKVSEEQIDRIVSGMLMHLQEKKDNIEISSTSFDDLPKVGIRLVKAEIAGVFMKSETLSLGDKVMEGDVVGEMLVGGSHHIVRSPYQGMVCEIDSDKERKVNIKDTLLGIGEAV